MSSQQQQSTHTVRDEFTRTVNQLTFELGAQKLCVKNCVKLGSANLSDKESSCYDNCLDTYNNFKRSYVNQLQVYI